jgi:DNA polymerase-3 subunit epsilon
MILTGIDFETTGYDPQGDHIIEVGAVLWDTDLKGPLGMASTFIKYKDMTLSQEIVRVTGIQDWMLEQYGVRPGDALAELNNFISLAEGCVAHNGMRFDKLFYEKFCSRMATDAIARPWIDTMTDVPYPEHMGTRKLSYLAAEHGFVNPFPHRAVFDVLTMMRILSCYDVEKAMDLARQPMMTVQAVVSFQDRELAKARGYYWDAPNKLWLKAMRQSQFETEQREAGFKVREVTT